MKSIGCTACLASVALLGCLSLPSMAATVTYSNLFGPADTNFAIQDQGFNTSLGTLNSVTVSISGTGVAELTLTNSGSSRFSFTGGSASGTLTFNNLDGSSANQTLSVSGKSGSVAKNASASFNGLPTVLSDNFTVNTGDMSAYTSTGLINFASGDFSSFTTAFSPANSAISASGLAIAQGTISVTYNYTATPEPGTYALLAGFATTGMGFLLRKRRMSSTV